MENRHLIGTEITDEASLGTEQEETEDSIIKETGLIVPVTIHSIKTIKVYGFCHFLLQALFYRKAFSIIIIISQEGRLYP